ncbi:hypothetical protein EJ04DRAFT_574373 [Polyplosphaeria fusca]|uniref:Uncharacterized protein n=1 Tax=Polyplosphaeria fusca TaxID=682080 RepID=A0A9P4R3W1_9PLEO|nr:hypothetical protein EJ04DRAFT_574373 [Polyplosphaeria fusca]
MGFFPHTEEVRNSECSDAAHYRNGYNLATVAYPNNWNITEQKVSISIGQQWYCDDQGPEKPVQFNQFGMRTITANTTIARTFTINSSYVVQNSMQAHALEYPKNVESCTIDSFTPGIPTVRIHEPLGGIMWYLVTNKNATLTHRTGQGHVQTSATNLVHPNIGWHCEASGDYINWNVTDPPYAPEKNLLKCSPSNNMDADEQGGVSNLEMFYDERTKDWTVQSASWSCWDIDPHRRYVFSSTTSAKRE